MSEIMLQKILNKLEKLESDIAEIKEHQKNSLVDQKAIEFSLKEIKSYASMTEVAVKYDVLKKLNIVYDKVITDSK